MKEGFNWKRLILLSALFAGFFFMIGFTKRYQIPRIKRWLLAEIEQQTREKTPVRVWPQQMDLHAFPPGVSLLDVKILPQKGLDATLAPFDVKEIEASLSLWGLLKGQLRLGELRVNGADVHTIVRKDLPAEKSPGGAKKKSNVSLDFLDQIPVDNLKIENVRLSALIEESGIAIQADNVNLALATRYRTLRTELAAQGFKIKKKGDSSLLEANFTTRFLLDEDGIYFSNFQIKREDSYVTGTGSVTGAVLNGKFNDIRGKLRGDWHLEQVTNIVHEFAGPKSFPKLSGRFTFETDFDYGKKGDFKTSFIAGGEELKIDHYDIGQMQVVGRANEQKVLVTKLSIENGFGKATAQGLQLSLGDKWDFKAQVNTESVELSRLLTAVGVPGVPVYTYINADLPCSGVFKPGFALTCQGKVLGRDMVVRSGKAGSEIVSFPKYAIDGSVTVDTKAVQYKAQLSIGSSAGESSGVINYNDGFKIKYSTPALDFANISNLSNLKLEGVYAIKGETTGNSKAATIDLTANGDKAWLSDFHLGKARFDLKYRKGVLYFDKVDGLVGTSRYQADVNIDINKSTIATKMHSPFLDAEDLQQVFSRILKFPIALTGTGSADIQAQGPLDIRKLSYNLHSSLFRGTLYDETYDQATFNVKSTAGNVVAENISLKKGRSVVRASGGLSPQGQLQLNVAGRDFQIEQSENLSRLKINITGNLNFDVVLTGPIQKPHIELDGRLSKVTVGDINAQDSQVKIKINENEITGEGRLIGDVLRANFRYPLGENGVTEIDAQADNWNFAQTFSIFSDSLRSGTYQTRLSGSVKARIPKNRPQFFDADAVISTLELKNGRAEMSSHGPLKLKATNGVIQTQNFELTGDNTYLRLKSEPSEKQNLDLTLEGRVDMSLLTLFTPFLDDLRGISNLSFQVRGPLMKPQLTGSAYLEEGLVKLRGFPHAFEHITGDAIFNNEKILINSFRGRLGGGLFSGNGRIDLLGVDNVPMDIRGQVSDAKLNVPEGFTTRGSGEFFIKGNWFPYTVGANYNVESGSIEKRAATNEKSKPEVKPSQYLPKFLSAQRFSPVTLALEVNLRKEIPVKMQVTRIDIKAEVTGQMKVNGAPDSPSLTGRINIARGGKVQFRTNTFEIVSGQLEYINGEPENPGLNVQAQARVTAQLKNNDTRDYDIDLRVLGTAKDPKITMYSEPALPESELLSLLTLGFISDSGDSSETPKEASAGGQLANTGYQIGSAVISEQLGINRALESRFGVQFDINSSYDDTDNAEKHKFTLRKQWTPKFGMAASREIGKTNTNNVKAEYKLNKNLSVIGEWEGIDSSGSEQLTDKTQKNQNIFGLDLEFKKEFR